MKTLYGMDELPWLCAYWCTSTCKEDDTGRLWREDTGSYVIRVGRSKAILCKSVKFFFPTYCVILSIWNFQNRQLKKKKSRKQTNACLGLGKTGDKNRGMWGFIWKKWKCFKIDHPNGWTTLWINKFKATELYTSNGWTVWYINCNSIKLLKKQFSKKWKDKPQTWRKYLQKTHLIKDWYPSYMKNS